MSFPEKKRFSLKLENLVGSIQ